MKKIFLISLMVVFVMGFDITAQVVQTLKVDPRIHTGTMPNGLTYYVIKNDNSNGLADFYLIQKTGTNVEDKLTSGMTSFISNMGLRGTRNFPENQMIEFFHRLGVSVREEVLIEVEREETLFGISNVPVKKSAEVVDSMLLVLYNWANSINLDEEDVEKERVFLENNSFTGRNLRSFYYKWFRPDLQAIVVVGDIDHQEIEPKIKSLFQAAPKSVSSELPLKEVVERNNDIIVVQDEEAASVEMEFSFLSTPLPDNLKLSATPLVINYFNDMLTYLLEDRIKLFSRKNSNQILESSVGYGDYYGLSKTEALCININTTPSFVNSLIYDVIKEIKRVSENGFTSLEFQRSVNKYFRQLRHDYYTREQITNKELADRAICNFTRGYSLASVELVTEFMEKVKLDISHKQFNTYVRALLGDEDSYSLRLVYPEVPDINIPTLKSVEKIVAKAKNTSYTPFVDVHLPSRLIKKELVPGTVLQLTDEIISGAKVYTLSNGATVVLKTNTNRRGRISFQAVAKGGLSLMDNVREIDSRVLHLGKLGTESAINVDRYKSDKDIVLEKSIQLGEDLLTGTMYSIELTNFMELLHLNFSSYDGDKDAFGRFVSIQNEEDKLASYHPDMLFNNYLEQVQYTNNIKTPDYSDPTYYEKTLSFLQKRVSNVADYTFIFVGDLDIKLMEPLILKYIGSLKGDPTKKSTWRVLPFYFKKQSSSYEFDLPISEERNRSVCSIKFPTTFDPYSILVSQVASEIMIVNYLRALYAAGIHLNANYKFIKYPEEFGIIELYYNTLQNSSRGKNAIEEIERRMMSEGVTQEELDYVRLAIKEKFVKASKNSNKFWVEVIKGRFLYGKDFYTKYLSSLDALTLEQVNLRIKEQIETNFKTFVTLESDKK